MYTFPEIMQNRLKVLRNAYSLPLLEAELVSGVSHSSLNFWERGTRMPSAEGIFQTAAKFGVSSDWLFGISNVPHTRDSVNIGESQLIITDSLLYNVLMGFNGEHDVKNLVDLYSSNIRNKTYSYHARADIIVCCLFLSGFSNYFKPNAGNIATLQQKGRMMTFRENLISLLKTGTFISIFPEDS